MADSFAGITVPEGEPGTIRDAAQTFRGLAAEGVYHLTLDGDGPD